jgi:uncharacterized protein YjbI with pentapeptide repeats
MRTLTVEEIKEKIEKHALWLEDNGKGECADFSEVDFTEINFNFSGLDLRYANFQGAILLNADFYGADLQETNLRNANLINADLQEVNLRLAYLQGADLNRAKLHNADLRWANLRGSDINYSCLPLRCGGLSWEIDERIASQLAYHFCSMTCVSKEFIDARNSILSFANKFYRVGDDCERLEPFDLLPDVSETS